MNAKWLPYLFTSCPGGAGLQVHSASQSLAKAELEELENASRYEPPPSANPTPSDAELCDFPVKHGFLRFTTGRFGIFKSQYVGKESSSSSARYGNYVVEAFVRSDGPFPKCPALYLDSPSFRDALAFRESVFAEGDIQRPLPVEDFDEDAVQTRVGLTEEELQADFSEHEPFYADILAHAMDGHRLILETLSSSEFLRRLEGLHRSVPFYLTHQLTGLSYTQSSSCSGIFFLQATAEPLPNYVRQEFKVKPDCVFFEGARGVPRSAFVQFIVEARLFSWENAAAFFEFLHLLRHQPMGRDLDLALLLWQLLQNPSQPCSSEDFCGALALGTQHGTPPLFNRALGQFATEDSLRVFFAQRDLERSRALFAFILAACRVGTEIQANSGLLFLSQAVLVFLESDRPQDAPELVRYMVELDPRLPGKLVADSTYNEWAEAVATFLYDNDGSPERHAACFQALAETLTDRAAPQAAAWRGCSGTDAFLKILLQASEAAVTPAVEQYFLGLSAATRTTAWLLLGEALLQVSETASGNLLSRLGEYFDSLSESERLQWLQLLLENGYEATAVALLSRHMLDSPQSIQNSLHLLLRFPRISESVRSQAVKASLDFLKKRGDFVVFCEVVLAHKAGISSLRLEKDALSGAVALCPSPPWTPGQATAIKQICELAQSWKLPLSSPLNVAATICDDRTFPGNLEKPMLLEDLILQLETIVDAGQYSAYAFEIVTRLWPEMKRTTQIDLVGRVFCPSRYEDFAAVLNRFYGTFREQGRIEQNEILKIMQFTDVLVRRREKMWRRLCPQLIETLSLTDSSNLERAARTLHERRIPMGENWDVVLNQARWRIHQREERRLGRRVYRTVIGIFTKDRKR